METNNYSSEDKLKWFGEGEWVNEPDSVTFTHEGLACKVIRIYKQEPFTKEFHMFGGYLCGYVQIPKDHELYGKGEIDFDFDIHEGLTWAGFMDDDNNEYFLGFDCGHIGDLVPSMEKLREERGFNDIFVIPKELKKYSIFNPTYRNIAFCVEECKSLATQINQYKKDS